LGEGFVTPLASLKIGISEGDNRIEQDHPPPTQSTPIRSAHPLFINETIPPIVASRSLTI
jgi:hypothetical protein